MAARITRAKRRLAGRPLDRPGALATVLRVLYLVFNEGYGAAAAHLHERADDDALAADLYAQAARAAASVPERDHLTRQAARLRHPPVP